MSRVIVLVACLALVLPSAASARPDPRVSALQTQVARLQRQVTTLQALVAQMQTQATRETNLRNCGYALHEDSFRTVFTAMSKFAAALTGTNVPAWESIPRYDDGGSCAAIGVTRP